MIPIWLAPLLQQGMSLLGNAALTKGKEWVEEKTGVNLSQPLSAEDTLKLRQFEMEHQEELLKLQLEENKLDAELFKAEVADRSSARSRDVELIKAGQHNYRADLMFVLALIVVSGLVWIVWKDPSINEYVKGIFTLVLGRFLGYLDNIYNFEFGSTRSSKQKDATIERLSKEGDK